MNVPFFKDVKNIDNIFHETYNIINRNYINHKNCFNNTPSNVYELKFLNLLIA